MTTSILLATVLATGAYPVSFSPAPLPVMGAVITSPVSMPIGQPIYHGSISPVVIGGQVSGFAPSFVSGPVGQPVFVSAPIGQPTFTSAPIGQPVFTAAPVAQSYQPGFVSAPYAQPSYQPSYTSAPAYQPSYTAAPSYAAPMRGYAPSYSFSRGSSCPNCR